MSLTEFLFIVLASMIGCILATVSCWLSSSVVPVTGEDGLNQNDNQALFRTQKT